MTKSHTNIIVSIGCLGLAALGGCSSGTRELPPGATQGSETTPETSQPGPLRESQILQVMTTVDQGEAQQARLALDRAQSPEVRQFAQRMIEQHTASEEEATRIAITNDIVLEPSPDSVNVGGKAGVLSRELLAVDAASFDRKYMEGQVVQHQAALHLIKTRLLPAAKTEALVHQLEATQQMVQEHLTHAQRLSVSLQ